MNHPTNLRRVFTAWWPLAASWLFMGTELPMISAVMTRLPNPTVSLAAYGGVVFPIALIIEAPVIMLLAASTALSVDLPSYRKLFAFMMWAGGISTALHVLLAFTPLFDVVVAGWMKVPAEIIEPSRVGMRIMLPWSWTIAYRRFNQGVLIRFGHSKAVSAGTALRLAANAVTLAIGWSIPGLPGIVVGTAGIAAGVSTEAIYAGLRARPVVRGELSRARPVVPALNWMGFYAFYLPLAATSFINLIVQPMGSAALSRMPLPLQSLAVWPVLGGFLFMWRSMGFAYNEVVVALLDRPGSAAAVKRFTVLLSSAATLGIALVSVTPLAGLWFLSVSGLDSELGRLALNGLRAAILWPAISIVRNYFQGMIVHGKKTAGITVSVLIFVGVTGLVLFSGGAVTGWPGLYVGLAAFQIGYLAQAVYLGWIARPLSLAHAERDAGARPPVDPAAPVAG